VKEEATTSFFPRKEGPSLFLPEEKKRALSNIPEREKRELHQNTVKREFMPLLLPRKKTGFSLFCLKKGWKERKSNP